jgi:hypothetical protein
MQRKKHNRKTKAKKNNETALDLRNCSDKYAGLEVSKGDLSDSRKKGICGTVTIPGWARPDGSNVTLLRLDFPEMGFVSYSEGPPHEI